MRKTIALLLVLLLALSGCGREAAGSPAAAAEQAPEMVTAGADPIAVQESVADNYAGQELPLPEGVESVFCLSAREDMIYLYGGTQDNAALYIMDAAGAVRYSYTLDTGKGAVTGLAPQEDGDVWVLTCRTGESTPDGRPAFLGGSVCRIRPGEGVMADFDLPEEVDNAQAIKADPARELLYVLGNGMVYALDWSGQIQFTLTAGTGIALTQDGRLATVEGQMDGVILRVLDPDSQSWGVNIPLGMAYYTLWDGGGRRDLFLSDGEKLYGLNLAENSMTPVAVWLDAGVGAAFSVDLLADGSLVVRDRYTAKRLTVRTGQDTAGPRTITLAAAGDPGILERCVLEFNNAQSEYRVSLRDYREYGDTALEQLGLDIASGDGPDLLDLTALPAERYARKGYLEDLYPYLDADPVLDRADMEPHLLAAMETDGRLYEFIPMVSVMTAAMSEQTYESLGAWSFPFLTPEAGVTVFTGGVAAGTDRYNFLLGAVCGTDSPFIDWKSAACDFDNEDFRAVLAIAAGQSDGPYGVAASEEQLAGRFVSFAAPVWGAWELGQSAQSAFGERPILPGLPGRDGQSRYPLYPVGVDLAISAGAQNKDGAWAFLRYCMMEQMGDIQATPLWTKHSPTSEPPSWQSMGVADPAPYEEAMRTLVESATGVWHADTEVMDIILDEAGAYFAGEATAEQTSAAIQTRVSLYVAEQS